MIKKTEHQQLLAFQDQSILIELTLNELTLIKF